MPSTRTATVVLLLSTVLAGCTDVPADGATDRHPSDETARERAVAAETDRIERHFANESGLDDLAFGAVADPYEATVTNRTADGVVVDLTVSIGYRRACDGATPIYADGQRIETTYLVDENETRLQRVRDPLPSC